MVHYFVKYNINPQKIIYCNADLNIEENYKKTFDYLNGENDGPFEVQELISKNILNETDIFYQQINSMPFGGGNSVLKINLLETESVGCLKDFLKSIFRNNNGHKIPFSKT